MNPEFENAKREAYARANAQWIKNSGRQMNEIEQIAFNIGFAEGRVSGGKAVGEILLGEFIK